MKNNNLIIIIKVIKFLTLLNSVKAANILAVLPTQIMSPQNVFTIYVQELANRGHEVTLVTANQFVEIKATENIIALDLNNKINKIWQKYNNIVVSNHDFISEVSLNLHTTGNLFEEILKTAEIKNLIKEKNSYFDLLLLDASVISVLSLSYLFKAPVILVSTTGAVLDNYDTTEGPNHPFVYPSIFQRQIYNLTTWGKLKEMFTYMRIKYKIVSNENKVDHMNTKYFGTGFPSIHELKRNVFALFINNNEIWAGNRPVSPNVVFMGGMQSKDKEELTQDLKSFLDKSRDGVIYVSFGSNVKPSLLPPKKLLRIWAALSEISYDIVMKWDNDKLPGVPKNIKIYKWLPQSSLLVHPKIKLFITNGDIQSTLEAVNAGVPLIGIPMNFDERYNTEKYIGFHIGLKIELLSLTEDQLTDAINLVTTDKSYRNSITELRVLMYGQPEFSGSSGLERAIWWTDKVLQTHRIRHLRPNTANISWSEYLELEIRISLLLFLFVVILVLILFILLTIRYVFNTFPDVKKKMI